MKFNGVVNNVSKVLNVTKRNVSLEILNNRLLRLYSKLGLLTYNMSCGFEVSQNSIDDILADIRSHKKQIVALKNEIKIIMCKPLAHNSDD